MVVSHARDFLNVVCTDILHLHSRKLTSYKGDFDTFERTATERLRNAKKAAEGQERQRAHMQVAMQKISALDFPKTWHMQVVAPDPCYTTMLATFMMVDLLDTCDAELLWHGLPMPAGQHWQTILPDVLNAAGVLPYTALLFLQPSFGPEHCKGLPCAHFVCHTTAPMMSMA